MDTSETYIKMCREANEVQKPWVPINGDFCWHDNEGEEAFGSWEFPAQVSIVNISQETDKDWWHNWLWLPRQDQLQGMFCDGRGGKHFPLEGLIKSFTDFVFTGKWQSPYDPTLKTLDSCGFGSMEQLWLAFVMSERHQKRWDGEEWVK